MPLRDYLNSFSYFFKLPFHIQWRTFLIQLPRYVPLSILHVTSPKGPHPFVIALPSRKDTAIPLYVFVPPAPVGTGAEDETLRNNGEWKVPVVLDFHGGGFIMGSPLEQAPYAAMMSRELGAVVISVSYRIGPFHQFPAAIHDAEDVLSAILDTDGVSKQGQILRTEIQRYHAMVRKQQKTTTATTNNTSTITLDPTRLSISGFSAGGNIALNMALSVPPCSTILTSPKPARTSMAGIRQSMTAARNSITGIRSSVASPPPPEASPNGLMSPLILPPSRAPTILDDPSQPWPNLLPPVQSQPRMLPLLLFYPSLDARLLPHERPKKAMPNALKGDDKETQQPPRPGLFSIMGPTYLPKRLRAHPRASPGLVDANDVQKNAAIFLVLPENDSLAVQSDVWVDKMNSSGWNGPVRFGDGRAGDWDGHGSGNSSADLANDEIENGGLEVWHAPGCRHGWTQFPETVLGKHEKGERDLVFARTLDFVKESWKKELPVEQLGSQSQEMRPLKIPARMPTDHIPERTLEG
ncbi:alpha/beta-hydrolase [Polyplosphaeria fusca]|uniref:Alpha/beta-hydrolase n=1 Tax=Polyplosphaeria fusca TaxID=682080 RepID=A0A9P4RD76_9PLEO|nr:alpha/beta-hydrolase [Polyplosphaeria fusca]